MVKPEYGGSGKDCFANIQAFNELYVWVKKVKQVMAKILNKLAEMLEERLSYDNSALDSTKFVTRDKTLVEIHILTRKAKLSLYASSFNFGSSKLDACKSLKKGRGYLLADRWYDDRHVIRAIGKHNLYSHC